MKRLSWAGAGGELGAGGEVGAGGEAGELATSDAAAAALACAEEGLEARRRKIADELDELAQIVRSVTSST